MLSFCPTFIVFWLITAPSTVGGCSVDPTSVVVTVGERVNLTCTTHEDSSITSWDLGTNTLEKSIHTVYTAPDYKEDGTSILEFTAPGYFVIRHPDNETIMHINKISLSQSGIYTCTCDLRDRANTTVVVLDSEPKLTTNHSGVEGEPVTFSCLISFNESSNVSCELMIEDAYGFKDTKRCNSTLNKKLIVCNLEHTVTANASVDQRHTCNVILSTQDIRYGGVIYSKMLNATVEWRYTGDKTSQSQRLAIGLSVAILAVVVTTAVLVCFNRR